MGDVGALVAQAHGPDEALVLDWAAGEVGPDKGRLRDHALPRLLARLLARLDHLEHLLLADALDLGERYRELGRLFGPLVLDGGGERFGVGGLATVEEVVGEWGGGGFLGGGRLDVAFFVRFDGFFHLDLLGVALLLVEFGAEAAQVLRILAG